MKQALSLCMILLLSLPCMASQEDLWQALEDLSTSQIQAALRTADVNAVDDAGEPPLWIAISNGAEADIIRLLVKAGSKTDVLVGEEKETVLFEAARMGHIETAKILLKKDPSLLNKQNASKENALFACVRGQQSKMAKFLLKTGIDRNVKNQNGMTALDLALKEPKENKKIIAVLKK